MTTTADAPNWADDILKPGAVSEAEPEEEEVSTGRGWRPVDLTAILNGTHEPAQPTVGARTDGVGLYYPGRAHTLAAESESGKTWFQLAAHAHEMRNGHGTIYIDFEDDESSVVGRLLAMNTPPDLIGKHFAYIGPDAPLTAPGRREELRQALGDLKPTLVTLDGVTEAMTLHGFDPLSNKDAGMFGQLLMKPLAAYGPAVVSLDHVTKDREGRGRYAIGAVHKLNGLNGAMYILENREPISIGRTGRSGIYVAKDRPAQIRRHALPSGEGRMWFGDLVVESYADSYVEVSITPAAEGKAGPFRPTELMKKVSMAMERAGRPLNKGEIEDRVTGKAEHVRAAVACLIDEGFIELSRQGNARLHSLTTAFVGP